MPKIKGINTIQGAKMIPQADDENHLSATDKKYPNTIHKIPINWAMARKELSTLGMIWVG
jgi:hypothetical protein